ncbi:OmpA family protein [Bacteroidota bacterium]
MLNDVLFHKVLFILILCSFTNVSAQFNILDENNPENYHIEFKKEFLEVRTGETFFNILLVSNRSNKKKTVKLKFSLPPGWSFFSEKEQVLNLEANDSIYIPLRGAASNEVLGEIGYSIIASLSDKQGRPLLNAYCFIKIPKLKLFSFTPVTRTVFFNQETKNAEFQFNLKNDGNVDELITLTFKSSDEISLRGEENNILINEISIPPKTDTTMGYIVSLIDENEMGKTMFSIDLQVITEESKFNTTFWIENLSYSYTYEIPDKEKPLILELGAHNLLATSDPYYSASFNGQVLFSKQRELFYYFSNHNLAKYMEDLNKNSKMYFGFNSYRLSFKAGDFLQFPLYNQNARGLSVNSNLTKKFNIGGLYSTSTRSSIMNYGISASTKGKNQTISTYYSYTQNDYNNLNSQKLLLQARYKIFKTTIESNLGVSSTDLNYSDKNVNKIGYHSHINFRGKRNKYSWTFKNTFGSRYYYGRHDGKNTIYANIGYRPNRTDILYLNYNSNRNNPAIYLRDSLVEKEQFSVARSTKLRYSKLSPTGIRIYVEPSHNNMSSNGFTHNINETPFTTHGSHLLLGFLVGKGNKSFSPYFTAGFNWVTNHDTVPNVSEDFYKNNSPIFNSLLTIRLRNNALGLYLDYYYGPYSLFHYYNYYFYLNNYQSVRVMPYYDDFIYKNLLKLSIRGSYLNEFLRKTQRVNLNTQLSAHLNKGYTITLLNTINFQRSVQSVDESIYKYNSVYFELKAKKEFEWNQPRYQYHTLTIIFYKDVNGNLKKDENEPGISDIYVEIDRIDEVVNPEYSSGFEYQGQFFNANLLSNVYGEIEYENIIKGFYRINFYNIGLSKGRFSSKENSMIVEMNDNQTIYIPFLEHNKIFGKVIMNRSKLSNLGKVDISNIKIKAIDSQGNETSTLSDKNGNFTIYAPSVDRYIVSINNIFYEHFDLQQNNFLVQLNGYKQFEVNFIFTEKRRQINFAPSFNGEQITIRTIKRTNLTGSIKDETTLSPLIARVEIIDNNSGEVVNSVHSDRNTGAFSLSFITGNNYSISVTKGDYWYHIEKLYLDQLTTIQDVKKDILLKNIVINSKFELKNLKFTAGSVEIPREAYPELDRLAAQLKENPNIQIQINGHADALETLDDEKLSEDRAKAVSKYLIGKGYSNISYVGYKALNPATSNDTQAGRAENRRVEIIIIDK